MGRPIDSRKVHPHWWEGSCACLGHCQHDDVLAAADYDDVLEGEGFGVTPAVLSTGGVINVLARLEHVFSKDIAGEDGTTSFVMPWLKKWGPLCW